MKKLAQFIKVLGDPNRLAIIRAIGRESRSVTEIINTTGLSQTLVSFHLRTLRDVRIVKTRREGPFIYYSLAVPDLFDMLGELSRIAGFENEITKETRSIKVANQSRR